MKQPDLAARDLDFAAVVDHVVRRAQPRRAIRLRGDHRGGLGSRDAVTAHQALEL